jgi:hypothetical protein
VTRLKLTCLRLSTCSRGARYGVSRLPLRDGMRVGYGREQCVRGVSVKDSSGVLPTVPGVEEYCVLPDRG